MNLATILPHIRWHLTLTRKREHDWVSNRTKHIHLSRRGSCNSCLTTRDLSVPHSIFTRCRRNPFHANQEERPGASNRHRSAHEISWSDTEIEKMLLSYSCFYVQGNASFARFYPRRDSLSHITCRRTKFLDTLSVVDTND